MMKKDCVQIKISDISDMLSKLEKLPEKDSDLILRQVIIDLVNRNKNSKFKFVRDTLNRSF
jgi:hypothetical protein